MLSESELKPRLKQILVESLMLKMEPEEIGDEVGLFDPEGLGLDSIDALELAVAVEKNFGCSISNSEVAKKAFGNINTLTAHILESQQAREDSGAA